MDPMRNPTLPFLFSLSLLPMLPAQTVDELITTLAKAESLDDDAVGIAGTKSETYRSYEALRDQATKQKLLELLDHGSAIVRGYAVRALAERKEAVDWPALLRKFGTDVAKVKTFEGCILAEQLLGDVVVEFARAQKLLSDDQWLDFAETLVAAKSPLFAREWALRNLRFRDGMLHPLRELAKAGDGPAHVALARYRLEKDLPLLIAHLQRADAFGDNTGFLAAQQQPDPALLPVLVGLAPKARQKVDEGFTQRLREWFAAIAVQQSSAAAQFLVEFLRATPVENKHQHRAIVDLVKAAVVPFPAAAVFEDVRAELKRHARR